MKHDKELLIVCIAITGLILGLAGLIIDIDQRVDKLETLMHDAVRIEAPKKEKEL